MICSKKYPHQTIWNEKSNKNYVLPARIFPIKSIKVQRGIIPWRSVSHINHTKQNKYKTIFKQEIPNWGKYVDFQMNKCKYLNLNLITANRECFHQNRRKNYLSWSICYQRNSIHHISQRKFRIFLCTA